MNHQETIEHYAKLKKEKAEKAANSFFGAIADALSPFVLDEKISVELAEEIMRELIESFRKMEL